MSHSVWVGRVSKAATYEELWAFLVANCGPLESLEWVAHKGFAVAKFVNAEDAAEARRNQSLVFQESTLWMDEVWSKDSSQKSRKNGKPVSANPAPVRAPPKKISLKRNASATSKSELSTSASQPTARPQILVKSRPAIQTLRPQIQTSRPQIQTSRLQRSRTLYETSRADHYAPYDISRADHYAQASRPAEVYLDPFYDQPIKRRREEIQPRLAPNFSISIQNTAPSWDDEAPEQAVGPRYTTSSSRFEAYSQLPAYAERRPAYEQAEHRPAYEEPLAQPHLAHPVPTEVTYYDDYASSRILQT